MYLSVYDNDSSFSVAKEIVHKYEGYADTFWRERFDDMRQQILEYETSIKLMEEPKESK